MNEIPVWVAILFCILLVIFGGCFGALFAGLAEHESSYKQGQIDYANGKLMYELVDTESGEVVWKKIPQEEIEKRDGKD